MESMVLPLPPGRYKVSVLYHGSRDIANYKTLPAEIIVSRSDPFGLVVHPAPPGAPVATRPTIMTGWYFDADEW